MRPVYPILLLLLCLPCLRAGSQPIGQSRPLPLENPIVRKLVLQPQGAAKPVARGTAGTEQLIGYALRDYRDAATVKRFDSARYYYGTADQPSYLDNNRPESYTELFYQGTPIQPWFPVNFVERASVGFDSAFSLTSYPGDTIIHFTQRTYSNKLVTHQSDSFISLIYGSNAASRKDDYQFFYNADSQIDQAIYQLASISDVSGTSFRIFRNGRLVKDSLVSLNAPYALLHANEYSYNQAGDLDTITSRNWDFGAGGSIERRESYAYDAGHKLLANFVEYISVLANGAELQYVDSFFYSGTRINRIARYGWNTSGSAWSRPSYQDFQYHFDALGNLDTFTQGTMEPVSVPNQRTVYTYTAGGHFDELRTYSRNNGVFSTYPSTRLKFYYQLDHEQGITRTSKADDYVQIYPNPAIDRVFVQFRQPLSAPVSVTLLNAMGQVMNSKLLTTELNTWSLENLPPAIYFLKFTDAEKSYSTRLIKR